MCAAMVNVNPLIMMFLQYIIFKTARHVRQSESEKMT